MTIKTKDNIKAITYVEDRVLARVYSLPVELYQGFKYKKKYNFVSLYTFESYFATKACL